MLGINDTVWVTISLNEVDNLLVDLIHIQSSINNRTLIDAIFNLYNRQKHFHLLLIEDSKLPQIDWKIDIVHGSHISFAALFYNTVQDAFTIQHVKLPARERSRQTLSDLALSFTTERHMIPDLSHLPPL